MGEQQQHKKRPRAEGSGGKKSSVLALSSSPVATGAPSAPAAPSPVATAKPASTVAATSDPLAAMPPAPGAPSPAATTEGDMTTPAATVVVTSRVVAMAPAAPSSAAIAKPAATVVDLEATSPVATVKPVRVVKPEDEVAEQEDAAMAAGAAEDVEVAILALPKKSFHCAACLRPLKPPVFRCENEHFVCHACGGDGGMSKQCGPCGRDVNYTRSRFMDGVVDAYKVPCLYKGHGCAMDDIPYHSAADHKASCKHAPCYCFDCRFVGSPAKLVRHLASPSGAHAWPVEKIRYEVPHPFVVPASSEDQRRLLVAEDGRVFLLAVGAGREPGGRRPVTVVCVRGNADADADAKPLFTGVLWVDGPPAPPRQPLGCSFRMKATVASCSVPGAVDMEQGWLHAHVSPNMLHGESGELHLRLCLTKLA